MLRDDEMGAVDHRVVGMGVGAPTLQGPYQGSVDRIVQGPYHSQGAVNPNTADLANVVPSGLWSVDYTLLSATSMPKICKEKLDFSPAKPHSEDMETSARYYLVEVLPSGGTIPRRSLGYFSSQADAAAAGETHLARAFDWYVEILR